MTPKKHRGRTTPWNKALEKKWTRRCRNVQGKGLPLVEKTPLDFKTFTVEKITLGIQDLIEMNYLLVSHFVCGVWIKMYLLC